MAATVESCKFIELHVGPEIELAVTGEAGGNYKSLLQQLAQREFGNTPVYLLLDEKGPDHAKCFKSPPSSVANVIQRPGGATRRGGTGAAACNALADLKRT